jgi:hypothetical protein
MAYTKSPQVSTYQTERVDFLNPLQQRSASSPTKDARLVNVLVEGFGAPNQENARALIKSRPGISFAATLAPGESRGIYFWNYSGTGYVYSVVGNIFYENNTPKATLTTSTGPVGFTEHVNDTGTVTLFFCDGTKGYTLASPGAALTVITDVDFPSPHVPFPIFMDGYIFLAKKNTQDIYNSDLNLPASWTAGQYVSAEMYADNISALAKNNNYIYAIGRNSIEYFYDAAIVNASPLQREASAVQQFGTIAPETVVQTEKEVILVGDTGNGGFTVWTIDGFKEKEIGTPVIRSALFAEGANLPNAIGSCVRVASQKLYILVLTSRTFVYSFDTQMWVEWASGTNNVSNFLGTYLCDGPNGQAYCLIDTGVYLGLMSESASTDLGLAIYCQVTTPKYDFGTFNRKTMSRMALIGDMPDPAGTGNTFTVEWSDDDYNTWSTARTMSFNYDFPTMFQLGSFRRRAFRITYSSPFLMRLDHLEFDLNKGNT